VIRVAVSPADGGVATPTQYAPGGTYYDTILRPTVDHARERGLYVIIDWHYVDTTTLHEATTTAFWTEMAPHFATDSNVLFELYNEPVNGGSWPPVKADMQMWYDVVRAAAPDNLVLVGTPNWCQYVGTAAASPITGTNVAYVAHMYPQHWAQPSLRTQIVNAAALVPVFVTEWGFEQDPANAILNGTITSYGTPFKQFIQQWGVSWTGWCASTSWRPTMFNGDFSLRTGDTAMGGFTKDWLYEQRAANQPAP
jgi:endoglucanase